MDEIVSMLRQCADEGYRAFHMRLMPNVESTRILGVRVPEVRALAKSLPGTSEAEAFLRELSHEYYARKTTCMPSCWSAKGITAR